MPLYEYRCKACGHRFEKIQSFSAADVKECPVCGSEVERLISAPAVQFKGSGFYSTDYGAKPSAPKADTGGGKSDAGSAAASSDSGSKTSSESSSAPASTPAPASSSTSSSKE